VPQLSTATLATLGGSLSVPSYDRSSVRTGIVHLGVGAFHRSHQAMYLDRLMEEGKARDWGICGVGVLPSDRRMAEVMAAQDCLYTLVVKHSDGRFDARVVGSVVEYLLAPDDPDAVVEKMAAEDTRIVSLTVTEGGYNIGAITGEFDPTHPDVVSDLRPGAALRTSFGLVTEALVRRRDRGLPPFTVVSCDNIQHNGDVARRSFAAFACGTRSWARGSSGRCCSRTRWSTGSPPRPRTTTGRRSPGGSASTTRGRWSASTSPSGCWRTGSASGARAWRTPASRSSTTSTPTSG